LYAANFNRVLVSKAAVDAVLSPNLVEFPENGVEGVWCASKVPHVAVLSLDVRAQLLVECRRVGKVPLNGADHGAHRLEA